MGFSNPFHAFIHLMLLLPRELNILRTCFIHLMLLLIFWAFISDNTNPLLPISSGT